MNDTFLNDFDYYLNLVDNEHAIEVDITHQFNDYINEHGLEEKYSAYQNQTIYLDMIGTLALIKSVFSSDTSIYNSDGYDLSIWFRIYIEDKTSFLFEGDPSLENVTSDVEKGLSVLKDMSAFFKEKTFYLFRDKDTSPLISNLNTGLSSSNRANEYNQQWLDGEGASYYKSLNEDYQSLKKKELDSYDEKIIITEEPTKGIGFKIIPVAFCSFFAVIAPLFIFSSPEYWYIYVIISLINIAVVAGIVINWFMTKKKYVKSKEDAIENWNAYKNSVISFLDALYEKTEKDVRPIMADFDEILALQNEYIAKTTDALDKNKAEEAKFNTIHNARKALEEEGIEIHSSNDFKNLLSLYMVNDYESFTSAIRSIIYEKKEEDLRLEEQRERRYQESLQERQMRQFQEEMKKNARRQEELQQRQIKATEEARKATEEASKRQAKAIEDANRRQTNAMLDAEIAKLEKEYDIANRNHDYKTSNAVRRKISDLKNKKNKVRNIICKIAVTNK